METTKVLIIGSGPAGYTAAIYASRANLQPILYEGIEPGGQLTTTTEIENFPGYPDGVDGNRMMADLRRQAERFGADLRTGTVTKIDLSSRPFHAIVDGTAELAAEAVIIATGGVLGEGFAIEPERAWEPIFNIDLPLNPSSPEWSLPEAYPACRQTPGTPRPSHGFALLGPDVDAKLRPLGKDGNPLCGNVFFIGKTLGGYDHAAEKSGNGVALSTALFAAMNA